MSWKYFTGKEMSCSHCGECHMDKEFMKKLDFLRECYGKPMTITSAYRCAEHPIEARKSKPGAHNTGKAADVAVSRGEAHELLTLAMQAGFSGIGIQQKGEGRFLHLDTCTNNEISPRPTVWSY
jgi:uncharacterized protein YcbK (DUF882 family)